jgi:hypothetical protein
VYIFTIVRKKEEKTVVHTNYGGGWLLAPFIADLVKKTGQAFDGRRSILIKLF